MSLLSLITTLTFITTQTQSRYQSNDPYTSLFNFNQPYNTNSKPDCSYVLCAKPDCGYDEEPEIPKGECCPVCRFNPFKRLDQPIKTDPFKNTKKINRFDKFGKKDIKNDIDIDIPHTVVDIIATDDDLSTLLYLLQITGLDYALVESGPFTVFAPTNDAFAKLQSDNPTLFNKVVHNSDLLTSILLYHVINDKIPSSSIKDGDIVSTLLSEPFRFVFERASIFIETTSLALSRIISTDNNAKNGIVHKINDVLIFDDVFKSYDDDVSKKSEYIDDSVADIAVDDKELTTLVSLLKASDLVDALDGKGPWTVFAPTNEAFKKLEKDRPDLIRRLGKEPALLRDILLYHVINDNIKSSDINNDDKITTLVGEPIKFDVRKDSIFIETTAKGVSMISVADLKAKNGVIHKINQVLLFDKNSGFTPPKKQQRNDGYYGRVGFEGIDNIGFKQQNGGFFGRHYY